MFLQWNVSIMEHLKNKALIKCYKGFEYKSCFIMETIKENYIMRKFRNCLKSNVITGYYKIISIWHMF